MDLSVNVPLASKPDHVPENKVFKFNLYNPPGMIDGESSDIHALWKDVQDTHPDIFWTPHNGGHWVVTRYADMVELTTKPDIFSSTEPFVPKGVIPHVGPSQLDAPEHPPFRKLVAQAFTLENLQKAEIRARKAAISIINDLRPKGRCDFMHDFAGVMPIVTFLNLLGMPESEQPYLHNLAERMTPGHPEMAAGQAEATSYIEALIQDRIENPTDDFISMLVRAQVMDRDLTDIERLNIVRLVVTGGLDTVINMSSFATAYFARNPDKQREVRENPDTWDGVVEEITRRFGTSNLARVARADMAFADVQLRKGDQVLGIFPLSGLDERVHEDPMDFNPRRPRGRHLNFGSGPHLCLGMRLAKRELKIFVEEWMGKMPEFHIAPGTDPVMSTGIINYMRDLHLEWKPA